MTTEISVMYGSEKVKKGVSSESEVDSGAYRCLREGGVDYGSVAYCGEEGGIFWRDSGRVAYIRGSIFWEGGVDSGRAG